MCILPDHEIMESLRSGKLRIDDFSQESLTPNGYDLRISEISVPSEKTSIRSGKAMIPPKAIFFVSTLEYVALPSDISAQLWLRTSWIRKGILAGLGKVDAGFSGTLTFMAYNVSDTEIEIPMGSRFVQMVLETLHSPATLTYEKRSGHYQGQKGITLAPINQKKVD